MRQISSASKEFHPSLHRGWVVLKSLKTPLRNIKMAPSVDLVVVVVVVFVVVVVDSGV